MKFTLVINQKGIVEAGLVGKVNLPGLCLLHYLAGWLTIDAAKTETIDGQKFNWLHYEQAVNELPVVFNPQAKLESRKNQLAAMIDQLRTLGLVETKKVGRRLFFRLTETALSIAKHRDRPAPNALQSSRIVTPARDDTVTPPRDEIVTSIRDEYLPTIIDETGTREDKKKETPPLSPSEGDAESIVSFWNSFPELQPVKTLTKNRARKIRNRLADRFWRQRWREGIERLAESGFAKGGGSDGWRATLDWFLDGDSLAKILEGTYDDRPKTVQQPSFSSLQKQIEVMKRAIVNHPAQYLDDATPEQRTELSLLESRLEELKRMLVGLPPTAPEPPECD